MKEIEEKAAELFPENSWNGQFNLEQKQKQQIFIDGANYALDISTLKVRVGEKSVVQKHLENATDFATHESIVKLFKSGDEITISRIQRLCSCGYNTAYRTFEKMKFDKEITFDGDGKTFFYNN